MNDVITAVDEEQQPKLTANVNVRDRIRGRSRVRSGCSIKVRAKVMVNRRPKRDIGNRLKIEVRAASSTGTCCAAVTFLTPHGAAAQGHADWHDDAVQTPAESGPQPVLPKPAVTAALAPPPRLGEGTTAGQQTASDSPEDAGTAAASAAVGIAATRGAAPQTTARIVSPLSVGVHPTEPIADPAAAGDVPPAAESSVASVMLLAPSTLAAVHSASAALAGSLGKATAAAAAAAPSDPGTLSGDTVMADATDSPGGVPASEPAGQFATPSPMNQDAPRPPQSGGLEEVSEPARDASAASPGVAGRSTMAPAGGAVGAEPGIFGTTPGKRKVGRSKQIAHQATQMHGSMWSRIAQVLSCSADSTMCWCAPLTARLVMSWLAE